jgi:hypothetical protein
MIGKITYLMHVQVMPKGLQTQLERKICQFVLGTPRGRLALHAPKDFGGASIPRLDLWQQALCAKQARRLLNGNGIWADLLKPMVLTERSGIFKIIRQATDLTGKPKDIMKITSPRTSLNDWALVQPLLAGYDEDQVQDILRLKISPRANRKVLDLKFRILHDTYLNRHAAPQCPHCRLEDSVRHRFELCTSAVAGRLTLSSRKPTTGNLSLSQILFGPWGNDQAACEAFLWHTHCDALIKAGHIDMRLPTLTHLINEFSALV